MKLSDAIRLGAMLGPQLFDREVKGLASCAFGSAGLAMGWASYCAVDWLKIHDQWKWAYDYTRMIPCPDCGSADNLIASTIASHLNDRHRWTRERIADWIATIEPQDIQNEQTDGGAGTHPTELSRSDEVQNIGV